MSLADPTLGPFTDRILQLNNRERIRFQDMAYRCNEARSSSWFNHIANYVKVNPPAPDIIPALASVIRESPRRMAELAAEQWYGVVTADVSPRVRQLATYIDAMNDEQFGLVERLSQHLVRQTQANAEMERVANEVYSAEQPAEPPCEGEATETG